MYTFELATEKREMRDITAEIKAAVLQSGVRDGICTVYCPHTTAGIMINENADPDVQHDILYALHNAYADMPQYKHIGGNSEAHICAGMVGASETLLVKDAKPVLGKWQSVYFCEFDGPRTRSFYVKVI